MRFFSISESIQQVVKSVIKVVFFSGFFIANAAYAITPPNAADMLANISRAVPNLMQLVTAIAYVIGIVFCLKGIVGLKHVGEARSMHHEQHGIKGPLILLAVGASLLYLPGAVRTGIATFWDATAPYAYQVKSSSPWSNLIKDVFTIIQLVGTVAFIRGLMMLAKLSGHGGHQASFGKAMTHMIAGIFCINMYQFISTISSTLGLGELLS